MVVSEFSESPYKKMKGKDAIFKVLDIHSSTMADRRKRQAYQYKQGFLRGILNDKGLVWEMRNFSAKAGNYGSVAMIKQV